VRQTLPAAPFVRQAALPGPPNCQRHRCGRPARTGSLGPRQAPWNACAVSKPSSWMDSARTTWHVRMFLFMVHLDSITWATNPAPDFSCCVTLAIVRVCASSKWCSCNETHYLDPKHAKRCCHCNLPADNGRCEKPPTSDWLTSPAIWTCPLGTASDAGCAAACPSGHTAKGVLPTAWCYNSAYAKPVESAFSCVSSKLQTESDPATSALPTNSLCGVELFLLQQRVVALLINIWVICGGVG
jgi:hypothetical protein